MKKSIRILGTFLLGILITSFVFHSYVIKNVKTSSYNSNVDTYMHFSKASENKVHIDSKIPFDSEADFLILLKDFSYINRIKSLLHEQGITILHEYKSAPLLLVKGYAYRIISTLSKLDFVKGIYANVRFYPKFQRRTSNYISILQENKTTAFTSELIGAKQLWELGITGKSVRVAVIDTGIYAAHPDLKWPNGTSKVVMAKSFVTEEYGFPVNENESDLIGHGTAVAGIIAGTGRANPDIGIGMAPDAILINAKVISGTLEYGTLAAVLAGMEWAVIDAKADVINLSLGGAEIWGDPTYAVVERLVKDYGAVIVAAAGNEGDGGKASMSVGSPGSVYHVICVGAVDYDGSSLAPYSSVGPTIYGYVKPDVVAPSNIYVITPEGYSSETWWGTSFSSPHVAGISALLVQYLKSKGVDYQRIPGFVKAALMLTAKKDISNYDALALGAGLVNATAAYELLKSTIETGSGKLAIVFPSRIPVGYRTTETFFPYYNKVFRGQTIYWNFTIVSSYSDKITIDVSSIADIFDFHSSLTLNISAGTNLWEFNATVKSTAPLGTFTGFILFYDSSGQLIGNVTITGEVAEPKGFVLFDIAHTFGTYWSMDFPWGQYRKFAEFLTESGFAIEILYPGHRYTWTLLERYDIIYSPDAASYYYIYDEHGFNIMNTTLAFSKEEIQLIKRYVQLGGMFIASCMEPITNNFTAFNDLAHVFHMHFVGTVITDLTVPATANQSLWFYQGIQFLPFYGAYIEPLLPSVMIGATYQDMVTMGLISYINKEHPMGLALLSSTNFLFDNWAFTGEYGVPTAIIEKFFGRLLDFRCNLSNMMHVNISNGETVNVHGSLKLQFTLPANWSIIDAYFFDKIGYGYIPSDMIFEMNGNWYIEFIPRISGNVTLTVVLSHIDGYILITNVEFYANIIEKYPDADSPVIESWEIAPSGIKIHDTVTVTVKASDKTTYVSSVIIGYEYMNLSVAENISARFNESTGSWIASFVLNYRGYVKIKIYAYDAAGNYAVEEELVFVRDPTPPKILAVSWTNIENVKNITFYAIVKDNIGVDKVYFEYTYDNKTWNRSEMIQVNETAWSYVLTDIRDAVLTIRIIAVDVDGNTVSKELVVGHVIPYKPEVSISWTLVAGIVIGIIVVVAVALILVKRKK